MTRDRLPRNGEVPLQYARRVARYSYAGAGSPRESNWEDAYSGSLAAMRECDSLPDREYSIAREAIACLLMWGEGAPVAPWLNACRVAGLLPKKRRPNGAPAMSPRARLDWWSDLARELGAIVPWPCTAELQPAHVSIVFPGDGWAAVGDVDGPIGFDVFPPDGAAPLPQGWRSDDEGGLPLHVGHVPHIVARCVAGALRFSLAHAGGEWAELGEVLRAALKRAPVRTD